MCVRSYASTIIKISRDAGRRINKSAVTGNRTTLIIDALRRRRGANPPHHFAGRTIGATIAQSQGGCHCKPRGISRDAYGMIDLIIRFARARAKIER